MLFVYQPWTAGASATPIVRAYQKEKLAEKLSRKVRYYFHNINILFLIFMHTYLITFLFQLHRSCARQFLKFDFTVESIPNNRFEFINLFFEYSINLFFRSLFLTLVIAGMTSKNLILKLLRTG